MEILCSSVAYYSLPQPFTELISTYFCPVPAGSVNNHLRVSLRPLSHKGLLHTEGTAIDVSVPLLGSVGGGWKLTCQPNRLPVSEQGGHRGQERLPLTFKSRRWDPSDQSCYWWAVRRDGGSVGIFYDFMKSGAVNISSPAERSMYFYRSILHCWTDIQILLSYFSAELGK